MAARSTQHRGSFNSERDGETGSYESDEESVSSVMTISTFDTKTEYTEDSTEYTEDSTIASYPLRPSVLKAFTYMHVQDQYTRITRLVSGPGSYNTTPRERYVDLTVCVDVHLSAVGLAGYLVLSASQ